MVAGGAHGVTRPTSPAGRRANSNLKEGHTESVYIWRLRLMRHGAREAPGKEAAGPGKPQQNLAKT